MTRWAGRVAVVALCAPFATCVQHRTVVTRPGVEVRVVDASGAPVAGAEVVVHWWSYPHGRLERSFRFTADAAGVVVATEQTEPERVAPFCMHGVPEHHYTLCAGSDGAGWRALEIEARGAGTVVVELPGGAYAGECGDHDRARFGGGGGGGNGSGSGSGNGSGSGSGSANGSGSGNGSGSATAPR